MTKQQRQKQVILMKQDNRRHYRKPHFVTRILREAMYRPKISYDAQRDDYVVIGRRPIGSSTR